MHRILPVLLLLSACGSSSPSGGANAAGAGGGGSGAAGSSGSGASAGSSGSGASAGSSGATNQAGGAAGRGGGSSGSNGSAGASGSVGTAGGSSGFADSHSGTFWLGPVDYAESQWHNACAPTVKYPAGIQSLYGNYIIGLDSGVVLDGLQAGSGQLCDACVELSANGQTLIAHAVTYGVEPGPNDIDVSPELNLALNSAQSRAVSWRFTTCPTSDTVQYTFDGRQWTNLYFFRVWVRNARLPVQLVEYRVGSGSWAAASSQTDGSWQASSVDFSAGFSLRVTAIDSQTLQDDLPGLGSFDPNVGVASHANFQ